MIPRPNLGDDSIFSLPQSTQPRHTPLFLRRKPLAPTKSNQEKFTRIGTSMGEKTNQDLVLFLKKSKDVFAWSHENMPGIDPSVITRPTSPSIRRGEYLPQNGTMPLKKLVTAEFDLEIYYPDWLAM